MIEQVVKEMQQKLRESEQTDSISYKLQPEHDETCEYILSCVENVRNTNSFMLMTINRCIDYTKASKGLKLIPKLETIDVVETLKLPVNCMKDVQSRVEIKFDELKDNICSHIITDKQWLQENVLCLLSNAVKYSIGGFVTIRLLLEELDVSQLACAAYKDNQGFVINKTQESLKREPSNITSRSITSQDADVLSEQIDSPVKMKAKATSVKSSVYQQESKLEESITIPIGNNSSSSSNSNIIFGTGKKTFLRVEIEDTGIGLSADAMEQLFHPFKQAQRLAGGTGLGIYLHTLLQVSSC